MSLPDSWLIDDPGDLAYPLRVFAEKPYAFMADMHFRDWHFPTNAVVTYWQNCANQSGHTFVCRDMKLRVVFQVTPNASSHLASTSTDS